MAKNDKGQGYGVFQKGDGPSVIATTVSEAVYYRFQGWAEVAPASPENALQAPAKPEDMGLGEQAVAASTEDTAS